MNKINTQISGDLLYVDASGMLKTQEPMETVPHSLSHAARTRINNIEMTTLMQLLTGLDNVQMVDLMAGLAMEWLTMHTGCDEGDIYRLMSNGIVIGWWKNQWHIRDRQMSEMLAHEFGKQLATAKEQCNAPVECRRLAHLAMLRKYINMHRTVMNPKSYQYRHLEESYAKIW